MKYFDYKENKQHGTFDFPIEFYHVTPSHPRYNMPYHWHTECEIIRILEGEFLLSINEEKITARKNDLIFIHDGIFHGGIPKNCIYECIVFDMKLLLKQNHACTKQIQDIVNKNKVIRHILPTNIGDLKVCCNYLFESMKSKKTGYEFITQGSLYHLLGIILEHELYIRNSKFTKKTEQRILQFKKVLSLIETEYSNPISLEDLSKAAGMTPKYFCRFFFEMSNKTPIEYLNFYRIESACDQLITTDLPVTEIALNCGFNDLSYFIKTFKKHKGITPKQYLKSLLYNTNQ
ncbi:AraC family transcriptional regulator [Romboutsia weinsteinii]|uniref:AraC family transcriptional regulator n=1 Tax=Romboutsia weinsteinii TaxID=2020949 RepID=A0A371J140_9FIRM|nr:AraC family transcriptional regulator [Romboutsia weinsteinii]RDY26376.1 AraC family transcriptional regulator [Romboutsia weinsteinii]